MANNATSWRAKFAGLIAAVLSSGSCFGFDWAHYHSIPIMHTCLAQDAKLANRVANFARAKEARLKEKFKNDPEAEPRVPEPDPDIAFRSTFVESPWAQCVKQRQWLSTSLCADFISAQIDAEAAGRPWDNRAMLAKHEREIRESEKVWDYFYQNFGQTRRPTVQSLPCPN